jgi:hypothetical protein
MLGKRHCPVRRRLSGRIEVDLGLDDNNPSPGVFQIPEVSKRAQS